jgi:phosphoribulokinase
MEERARVPRPILLGVVGDSAAGKTTMTRGLVRVLGEENVTHVCTDDYHSYDRQQRAVRGITPLHPDCNYVDIIAQHLGHLRAGEPILKPVYQHSDGTFGVPVYVQPARFVVVEGLLGFATDVMRQHYDIRVYLKPPEEVRRRWKVQRDVSRRGYSTSQVLAELDRREPDSEHFIRPQERFADIVVSFTENGNRDQERLDAELTLRPSLHHPDFSPVIDESRAITLEERDRDWLLHIAGDLDVQRGQEVEETLWERMHFARHLHFDRLGEFTIGTELHRSECLAVVQMLILYHLVTAKASVALGADGARALDTEPASVEPTVSDAMGR